jgi:hypothetical protein
VKIILTPDVFLRLAIIEELTEGREFSGYGFIEIEENDGVPDFRVYDIELLDVGTQGFTEFGSSAILQVMKREDANNMKLWFHKHPLGNGKPGAHNWSKIDNDTCTNQPLGCPDPDRVRWALAMVLTPGGWVGRVDRFAGRKCRSQHIQVDVELDWDIANQAQQLLAAQKAIEQSEDFEAHQHFSKTHKLIDDTNNAHAEIDDAFAVIEAAQYMLEDGYIQEAIEATSWVDSIARFYQKNANVKHRIKKLLKKTDDIREIIEKECK